MLVAPARDLRLDVLRGWMQVSIFISHVVGTQLSWGIHAAWGVSDSSEQFLFLSGFTLGSVFALKASRMGETAAARDLGGRTLRLYATQMKLFLTFMALVMLSCWFLPWAGQLDKLGWRFLVEHPWQAIPGAAAMLYQPSFLGILPSFVFSMLLLAPFLWLHARIGAWALLPSGALWAAVQAGWIATPGIGPDGLAFDPLAWQFLYMIGATMGVRALHGRPLPRHWLLLVLAAAVVLGGLVQALASHGFIEASSWVREAGSMKEVLAWTRLLHALALAWLVAVLLPRRMAWMEGWLGRVLAPIGARSLPVFCLGLFLAWFASLALMAFPDEAWWLDPACIALGVASLALYARYPLPNRSLWRMATHRGSKA
jgi:hypothetical protein